MPTTRWHPTAAGSPCCHATWLRCPAPCCNQDPNGTMMSPSLNEADGIFLNCRDVMRTGDRINCIRRTRACVLRRCPSISRRHSRNPGLRKCNAGAVLRRVAAACHRDLAVLRSIRSYVTLKVCFLEHCHIGVSCLDGNLECRFRADCVRAFHPSLRNHSRQPALPQTLLPCPSHISPCSGNRAAFCRIR